MTAAASATDEWRRGWHLVALTALGLTCAPTTLPVYTLGVFVGPFEQEFGWSREIGDSAVAVNAEAAAELLARAQSCPDKVVGPYLVDAAIDAQGRAAPAHFREVFRTRGPSNYPEHGRQAER